MLFNRLSTAKAVVSRNSKVSPVGLQAPKRNHIVPKNVSALSSIKILLRASLFLAVNRFYLLKPNRCSLIMSYVYAFCFSLLIVYFLVDGDDLTPTYAAFKYTCCSEYILIVTTTLLASKKKMLKLFRDLDKFDELLNISRDLNVIDSGFTCLYWMCGCLFYSLLEYIGCYLYLTFFIDRSVYCFYIVMMTHDFEQILFFMLLRTIYLRLRVIKAHVFKLFVESSTNIYGAKFNKVEELANNARLDISSLHRVYDLLHKCADQLNSIMSLPMLIILFTAGLSTTILLKMMVKVIQTVTVSNTFGKSTILYLFGRGMKYTILVVVPCCFSKLTSSQVTVIRTVLHDAISSHPLDKIERRKLKALFQLTRENEFTYALGKVITLNMSLPLSYISLCSTYLLISIQFSKFFD